MSCSLSSTKKRMLQKGFIDPNMNIMGNFASVNLYKYLKYLDKLAKDKYGIEMGPLFSVKSRLIRSLDNPSETTITQYLLPNNPAFEAIDRSKAAEENQATKLTAQDLYRVVKDSKLREIEGNYKEEEGDIIVPSDLPQIKIKCK